MTDKEFKYNCVACDFHTDRKNNYTVHLGSKKHKRETGTPEIFPCDKWQRTYIKKISRKPCMSKVLYSL